MFRPIRSLTERILRIPSDPAPPPGDESTTQLFRAAPNYYYYLLVTWLLRTAVVLLALVPAEMYSFGDPFTRLFERTLADRFSLNPPLFLLALILVQRLFALALLRLDFEKRWYLVTNRSLRVREGVLKVREMTITIANIQNISVSQGPIQRLLGIADLRVDTAGGRAQTGEKEGKEVQHGVHFRGVSNAEEIRDLINARLRALKDSGLGDTDEQTETAPSGVTAGKFLDALREVATEAKALRAVATDYLPSS